MISSILDNKEEIIKKITEKTGLPREEIERRIKEKVEEYGGLLTESGAAFAIARELGVQIGAEEQTSVWEDIGKLSEDLGFASVVGVVKAISSTRSWEKEGSSGKVVRMLLADKTGETWVALWNQDAELVEKGQIKVGDIIGIKNGLVRKNIKGEIELSVGMRSRVIIDPKTDKEFPEVGETKSISELKAGDQNVSVFGRVIQVFPRKTFTTGDRTGEIGSMIITDGKAIRVVLWGENAKLVDDIYPGTVVKVENGSVKENNGNLEIHVGWSGRVLIDPDDAPELPELKNGEYERKAISDIEPGDFVEVRGLVAKVYPPTKIRVCPVCGAVVEDICPEHGEGKDTIILNIEIDDGTGVIRGVLFRNLAERFLGLSEITDEEISRGIDKVYGEELIFGGQAKNNELFDRKELHIRYFRPPDIDEEIKRLRGE